MEVLVRIVEKTLEKVLYTAGAIIGWGFSAAGEKVAAKMPEGRSQDRADTARRIRREQRELFTLYQKLKRYAPQAEGIATNVCEKAVSRAIDPSPEDLKNPFVLAANHLCQDLLSFEGYFPLPEIDFSLDYSMGETWDLTARIRRCLAFYETRTRQEKVGEILTMFLYNPLHDGERRQLLNEKLIRPGTEELLFSASLESLHEKIPEAIEEVGVILGRECSGDGEPFPRLYKQYEQNILQASEGHVEPLMPREVKGKSNAELVHMYLVGTPFSRFFTAAVPFVIPLKTRFSHMHILGGSGHGKTQTLQSLFLSDLAKVGEGERSVIVIDSQGDLIHNILKLQAVGDIPDRVVLIYPKDLAHPPALNLFDFGLERALGYSDVDREMLLNGAVSLYEYMFGAVLGAELTAKQGVIFGYLARLLLVVPGATITTLIDFLEEPEKVRPYLPKLRHPLTRRFFDAQFFDKSFAETRQQLLYRIYDVMKTDTIARMFQNPRNKVNIFEAMNRGSLILIHTAKDLLKQEGCEILGRFFIALIAQAAQERAAIPEQSRTPTFVYIDEAADYFDENIEILLEQARKFNVGMILAHQHLGQFESRQLRASVAANTAIKLAGGLSEEDARALCANMGTTAEFLLSMKKYEAAHLTQFACFVRNLTHTAISLSIPLGILEEQPKIKNPHVLNALFRRNWEKYCTDLTDEYPPEEGGAPGGPANDDTDDLL
jgi:hypothetical protein